MFVDSEIDLPGSGVAKGDKVDVSVEFWDEEDLEDGRPKQGVSPKFSTLYKTDAIQSGWVWSGDVVFTHTFQGRDDFTANAAVSFERHWYQRDDPEAWLNRVDPGLGFHAAQLNQDPDTTTEIGVGLNLSIWDGLLRTGVGYNISVDSDEEYWFFGFGVVSALDSLKSLTPGDGD